MRLKKTVWDDFLDEETDYYIGFNINEIYVCYYGKNEIPIRKETWSIGKINRYYL